MRIFNGHFYTREMKDDTSKGGKVLKQELSMKMKEQIEYIEYILIIHWIYFDIWVAAPLFFRQVTPCSIFPLKHFKTENPAKKTFPCPHFPSFFFLSTEQKKFCLTGWSNQRDQSSGCGRVSFSTTDPVPLSHPAFIFKRSLSKTQKVKCNVTDL